MSLRTRTKIIHNHLGNYLGAAVGRRFSYEANGMTDYFIWNNVKHRLRYPCVRAPALTLPAERSTQTNVLAGGIANHAGGR